MTVIYSSDGSNSHPKGEGPAGAAFCINDADPHYLLMETGTNNEAEMYGFCRAVEHASGFAKDDVVFHTDSQWVAYTVAGYLKLNYLPHYHLAVKNAPRFKPMLDTIQRLWKADKFTIKWVIRSENRAADRAAGIARERAMEKYGVK